MQEDGKLPYDTLALFLEAEEAVQKFYKKDAILNENKFFKNISSESTINKANDLSESYLNKKISDILGGD